MPPLDRTESDSTAPTAAPQDRTESDSTVPTAAPRDRTESDSTVPTVAARRSIGSYLERLEAPASAVDDDTFLRLREWPQEHISTPPAPPPGLEHIMPAKRYYSGPVPAEGSYLERLEAPASAVDDDTFLRLREWPQDQLDERLGPVNAQFLLNAARDLTSAQRELGEMTAAHTASFEQLTIREHAIAQDLLRVVEDQARAATLPAAAVTGAPQQQISILMQDAAASTNPPSSVPPPLDTPQMQTQADLSARLAMAIEQNTEDLDDAGLNAAAAGDNTHAAARALLDVYRDSKQIPDWWILCAIACLWKVAPTCHVHFHIGRTAQAGVVAVRAVAAGTTATGLAVTTGGGTGTATVATGTVVAAEGAGATGAAAATGTVVAEGAGGAAAAGTGVSAASVALITVSVAALVGAFIFSIHRWVEGFAMGCTLSPTQGHGTCPAEEAGVVVISEEGPGSCYSYFYRSVEEATTHAGAWRMTSRILFSGVQAQHLHEEAQWGPAMPYKTIRGASRALQEQMRGRAPQ